MNPTQVLDLFTQSGALLEGHFQLSSGLHSPGYLQCALVLQYPDHAARLGTAIADRVRSLRPSVVLSPALGGTHQSATRWLVRLVFVRSLRNDVRGDWCYDAVFDLRPAEQVLVVEDVITTGKSTRETIDVARDCGAEVVGAASVINRGLPDMDLGVRFDSLAEVSWPTHDSTGCPLCRDGLPVTRPGSRPNP